MPRHVEVMAAVGAVWAVSRLPPQQVAGQTVAQCLVEDGGREYLLSRMTQLTGNSLVAFLCCTTWVFLLPLGAELGRTWRQVRLALHLGWPLFGLPRPGAAHAVGGEPGSHSGPPRRPQGASLGDSWCSAGGF